MCTITQSPGKFEGEPCITLYAYHWIMEGLGDIVGEDEGDNTEALYAPHTLVDIEYTQMDGVFICDECKADILAAGTIRCWEDDLGFVYSDTDELQVAKSSQ